MPHLFCFGLGYTALHLALILQRQGWKISGTSQSDKKCINLRIHGINALLYSDDDPLSLPPSFLKKITHVLISIPPKNDGDPVWKRYSEKLLHKFPSLQWVGYLSTTGVYGDTQGQWVNETAPLAPITEKSKRRVLAEQQWLQSGLPIHIFRLAGIYGKGRNILISLRDGTAQRIYKPNQVSCRIHVEDIVQILGASILQPSPKEIFNCADDCPTPAHETVAYGASLLHMEPPPLIPLEESTLSSRAKEFYQATRRIDNTKIKEQLKVKLLFPDYKAGLRDCMYMT